MARCRQGHAVALLLSAAIGCAAVAIEAQPADWIALFDGKTADDWIVNTPGRTRPKVEVADGAIRLAGGEGYLALPRVFENFELELSARVSDPTGANGRAELLFRCQKHDGGRFPAAYHLLIEPKNADKPTGTIAGLGVAQRIDLKDGDWLKIRLVVNDNQFVIFINDKQVLDCKDDKRQFDRGHILLDHSPATGVAEFREIRVKELPSSSTPIDPGPRATAFAPVPPLSQLDGFVPVFDGKTLNGWRRLHSVHGTASGWQVINGALCGTQRLPNDGGFLGTQQLYGDFELSIDLLPDFGIDSGILLRGDDRGRGYQVLVDYNGGNVAGLYGEEIGAFYRPAQDFMKVWKKDQWNNIRARITGNPPHITTWLNGTQQLDWQDDARRLPDKGRVVLQVHGGRRWPKTLFVRYANVQIKPIEPGK